MLLDAGSCPQAYAPLSRWGGIPEPVRLWSRPVGRLWTGAAIGSSRRDLLVGTGAPLCPPACFLARARTRGDPGVREPRARAFAPQLRPPSRFRRRRFGLRG